MKLFESLAGALRTSDTATLTVSPLADGRLVVKVVVTANNIESKNAPVMPPFMLKDTPAALDEGIGDMIAEPVKTVSAALADIEDYRKKVAEAAKDAKKDATPAAKPAAPKTNTSKTKYEELIAKAKGQMDKKDYDGALKTYEEASKLTADAGVSRKELDKKIDECKKAKANSFSSFDFFGSDDDDDNDSTSEATAEDTPAEEPAEDMPEETEDGIEIETEKEEDEEE